MRFWCLSKQEIIHQMSLRMATEEDSADDALASALTRLRAVDDKSYLAYALNGAAHLYREAGRTKQARLCASEALMVASVMRCGCSPNAEAASFAERGLRHAARLAEGAKLALLIALLKISVLCATGPGPRRGSLALVCPRL
jgi:hypothetical protein